MSRILVLLMWSILLLFQGISCEVDEFSNETSGDFEFENMQEEIQEVSEILDFRN